MSSDLVKSFNVGSTLAAKRAVTHTTGTAWTVKAPASVAEMPIGVAIDSVKDTTSAMPVQINGIAKLEFGNTVSSGALVAVSSTGRGIAFAATTAGTFVIGTLVDVSMVAGDIGNVLLNPHFQSIP